jgi:hypothetical protein
MEAMAAARRGKPRPPHVMGPAHAARRGSHHTEETRRRMSEAHRRQGTRPPKAGRPWTPEEDQSVRTPPPGEAAERTGRTRNAVYGRRRRPGLPDGRAGLTRRPSVPPSRCTAVTGRLQAASSPPEHLDVADAILYVSVGPVEAPPGRELQLRDPHRGGRAVSVGSQSGANRPDVPGRWRTVVDFGIRCKPCTANGLGRWETKAEPARLLHSNRDWLRRVETGSVG